MSQSQATARTIIGLLIACALSLSVNAFGKEPHPMNVNSQNVFLNGYDVVAYFQANEAMQGSTKHATTYHGTIFHFSNHANLEGFQADPPKYLPKYNGFCAFGVANGKGDVKANPKTFKLYNGELLMFFDDQYEGKRFNTSIPWNANEDALHTKAEEHWSHLSQ